MDQNQQQNPVNIVEYNNILAYIIDLIEKLPDEIQKQQLKNFLAQFSKRQIKQATDAIKLLQTRLGKWKYSKPTTVDTCLNLLKQTIENIIYIEEVNQIYLSYANQFVNQSKDNVIDMCSNIKTQLETIQNSENITINIETKQKRLVGLNLQNVIVQDDIQYYEHKSNDKELNECIEKLGDKIIGTEVTLLELKLELSKKDSEIDRLKKELQEIKQQIEEKQSTKTESFGTVSQLIKKYEIVFEELEKKQNEIFEKEKIINDQKQQMNSLLNTIENLRFDEYTKLANEIVKDQIGVTFQPKLLTNHSKETYIIDLEEMENEILIVAYITIVDGKLHAEKKEFNMFDLIRTNIYEKPQKWSEIAEGKKMLMTILFKNETYEDGIAKWNERKPSTTE